VTYGGHPPRAYRGSAGWVVYAMVGAIFAGASGLVGWVVLHRLSDPARAGRGSRHEARQQRINPRDCRDEQLIAVFY
jgi:hypothetical protein